MEPIQINDLDLVSGGVQINIGVAELRQALSQAQVQSRPLTPPVGRRQVTVPVGDLKSALTGGKATPQASQAIDILNQLGIR